MKIARAVIVSLCVGCGDHSGAPDASLADARPIDGFGDSYDCDLPIVCGPPAAGKALLCGEMHDLSDSSPLDFDFATTTAKSRYVGVSIIAVDDAGALAPGPPLAITVADACGEFHSGSFDVPPSGRIAILLADSPDAPAPVYLPTATLETASPSEMIVEPAVFVVRRDAPAAPTTGDGAAMLIYVDPSIAAPPLAGDPQQAVDVSCAPPSTLPSFADSDPLHRTVLAAGATTGRDGAILARGTGAITCSAAAPSCSFASTKLTLAPGTMMVAQIQRTCP
jgi:hypothetical protein